MSEPKPFGGWTKRFNVSGSAKYGYWITGWDGLSVMELCPHRRVQKKFAKAVCDTLNRAKIKVPRSGNKVSP